MERHMDEILDPVRASLEIVSVVADRLVNAGGIDLLLWALDLRIKHIEKRWVRNTVFVVRDILLPQPRTYYFQ